MCRWASIIKTLAKGTLVISSLLGAHIGTDKPQINKYCIWSLLPAVFWSLPSVTSRPSAFGLNFGSCFHCPHLLIPSLGFYFLISLFLLQAEKSSCSVMKCHRGNVLNLLHPSFLRNANMSKSPGLQKITLSDLTLPLSAYRFKAKDSTGFRYLQLLHAWETEGLVWAQDVAETCQVHCSSSAFLLHVLSNTAASGPKYAIWGTQSFEESATLDSAYILLDKRLRPLRRFFWEISFTLLELL